MRSLRFVHLAGDGTHLVLETADGGEQFVLPNDALVRESLRSPEPRSSDLRSSEPPTSESATVGRHASPAQTSTAPPATDRPASDQAISPREIQTRVRAGESPEGVAESLGVPLERIVRFAAPVVDERMRITDEARRARARRGNTEGAPGVFGEIVDERFTAHGIAPLDVTWDSYRRDDGEWVVLARWLGGAGQFDARWLFHRGSRSVTPVDEASADLLSDRPIRPVAAPETAAGAQRPGVVSFPPMPEALTGPLPAFEEVFDQEASHDAADAARLEPTFAAEPIEYDEPPLPLGIADPATRPAAAGFRLSSVRNVGGGRREDSDEERAARVKVPSWDDILLGVRRKQD